MTLRRLAMLEAVYRLAPDLLTSGHLRWPAGEPSSGHDLRLTDIRLLRHWGFHHAVGRYGPDVWTPFIYAGLHATERALRRKERHQLRGVDAYVYEEDRYLRIANRVFYEDPQQEAQPSARVVAAAELARQTLTGSTPTLIWTLGNGYGGNPWWSWRVSRDLVADPSGHPALVHSENIDRWPGRNADLAALEGPRAYRAFITVAEFPAVRGAQLRRIVGGTAAQVRRILDDFVNTGLVAEFDGRYYLAELGMRRAATLSRVSLAAIRPRHGAYL